MNTHSPLSKRFASFGTSEQRSKSFDEFVEEVTIPVDDLIRVYAHSDQGSSSKGRKNKRRKTRTINNVIDSSKEELNERTIGIATKSFGSYELRAESSNEQLVLMTFIRANVPKGKVVFVQNADMFSKGTIRKSDCSDVADNSTDNRNLKNANKSTGAGNNGDDNFYQSMIIEQNSSNFTQSTGQSQKSFDVEEFTAKRMSERLKSESLSEKIERRMHRFISSLEERKFWRHRRSMSFAFLSIIYVRICLCPSCLYNTKICASE